MQANYIQRIRLVLGKSGSTRYIGHLDLARTLERAINRANIPIAYTQGFNKRHRMQMADALPLGFTSECEIADLLLGQIVETKSLHKDLSAALPAGIDLHSVSEVPISEKSLQNQTRESSYVARINQEIPGSELQKRLDELMSQSSIVRERRGKEYDLRPRIFSLSLSEIGDDEVEIEMILSLAPGEVGRPDEVLNAMGLDPLAADIHRTRIRLEND
jgi:radical SAM-linked protein